MPKVFKSDSCELNVYPEKKIVHHEIHKFLYGDEFKNFMMNGADQFIKYNCNKWLSDDRGNSAIRHDDLEWAQKNWEPKILKAGWKAWGLILPEKAIGQLNMKRLVDRYESLGVNVRVFSDPDSAMEWLEKQ